MTYLLWVTIDKDIRISIGRLGVIDFKKGKYIYIGSAKRYLSKRINRHLEKYKKLFWHIDYLLCSNNVRIQWVWVSRRNQECQTARYFRERRFPFIEKFGSSDCRCKSHLFFVGKDAPRLKTALIQRKFAYADKSTF